MNAKVIIEIDPKHEAIVRQALAMSEEMEQLALTAADGTVFEVCEKTIIQLGRRLQSQMLGEAVARRIDFAEKKGPPSGAVPADVRKKTKARKNDIS
jgi:hypothetical protein